MLVYEKEEVRKMLTPQDIREKEFSLAMPTGIAIWEVEEFLDILLKDYETLYQENIHLRQKMKDVIS